MQLVTLAQREQLELLVRLVLPEPRVLLVNKVLRALQDLSVGQATMANQDYRVRRDLREYPEIANLVLQVLLDPQVSKDNRVFKVLLDRLGSVHQVFLVKQVQLEQRAYLGRLAKQDLRDFQDLLDL